MRPTEPQKIPVTTKHLAADTLDYEMGTISSVSTARDSKVAAAKA